jgi:hypothetical protein
MAKNERNIERRKWHGVAINIGGRRSYNGVMAALMKWRK